MLKWSIVYYIDEVIGKIDHSLSWAINNVWFPFKRGLVPRRLIGVIWSATVVADGRIIGRNGAIKW